MDGEGRAGGAPAPGRPAAPRAGVRHGWRTARAVVAWVAVAAVAGWLVVRAAGVGRGTVVETAVVFTPYVSVASVVVVLATLALRVRRAALAATGCCVGYALVMTPLFLTGPSPVPPPRGPELGVMTVNVQFGWADAAAVVDLVRAGDVDVLGVQELTPAFADRLAAAGIDDLLPHQVVDSRPGAAGSGLYSRHPVEPVHAPVVGGFANPTARVDVAGARPVEVTVVHAAPPVTAAARAEWRRTLRSLPVPQPRGTVRLLIGDFNATVDQPTMRDVLGEGYVDAAGAVGRGWVTTWRLALAPPLAIDHVLVDRATAVDGVSMHDVSGSDHRAVMAELRLPSG